MFPIITSFGNPIVIVVPAAEVSTSLVVPATVNVCDCRATVPVPVPPAKFKFEAIPVNPEPFPENDPVKDPVKLELAPVN